MEEARVVRDDKYKWEYISLHTFLHVHVNIIIIDFTMCVLTEKLSTCFYILLLKVIYEQLFLSEIF